MRRRSMYYLIHRQEHDDVVVCMYVLMAVIQLSVV